MYIVIKHVSRMYSGPQICERIMYKTRKIFLTIYNQEYIINSNDRHRPVLVKLTRSCDVSNILANRGKLSNLPGISIKPLMSPKERNTESILLRERYIVINSGTSRSVIKIRRNALYINNTKYGSVTDSIFTLCSSPSKNTTQASPVAPCNTSTNAASHEDITETHLLFIPSRMSPPRNNVYHAQT